MNFDLRFYLQRFWHRFPWFLIVATVISAVGLTLAVMLPPVYKATAQLLVENPTIPTKLAASTVDTSAPTALSIIKQRVLTRSNLLDMAQQYNIYNNQAFLNPDAIVKDMRKRTTITLPADRAVADFVTVSFAAPTGTLSAKVTNDFVTQILQENVKLRTQAATQTLNFFKQEVNRLGTLLGQQGAKIMQFKLAHRNALPDSLNFRHTRQTTLEQEVLTLNRDIASLKDRKTSLTNIYQSTGSLSGTTPTAAQNPTAVQLQQLKDQLASALAVYSPKHPAVLALQAKIAALEAVQKSQAAASTSGTGTAPTAGPGTPSGAAPNAAAVAFKLQIASIDSQISFDQAQKKQAETALASLQASIDATPGNAIQLDALQRNYDNTQSQYNAAVARLGTAQTGDRIEALSQGQRITVIEQAVKPTKPTSPHRTRIALASIVGGLALGLGFVVLLEVLNRSVHRPADLVNKLGIQAFATVPYLQTRGEVLRRRTILASVVLVAGIGIPATLYAVNQYYLPLNLLVGQVLDKL